MPRFSSRLTASLGLPAAEAWPDAVELVPPGSHCALDRARFFTAGGPPPALEAWLRGKVAVLLGIEGDFGDHSLPELGANSLAATTLQYHALNELKADLPLEVLLDDVPLSALASTLAEQADPELLAALLEEAR
ncbi:hypothetical protein GCM10029992_25120 [Glycomyces albus]